MGGIRVGEMGGNVEISAHVSAFNASMCLRVYVGDLWVASMTHIFHIVGTRTCLRILNI